MPSNTHSSRLGCSRSLARMTVLFPSAVFAYRVVPSPGTPFLPLLSCFPNGLFRTQFKSYSVCDHFYPTISGHLIFSHPYPHIAFVICPSLNCHSIVVPGMGSSSSQLAYKVSQGGDAVINFLFAIKPSSENVTGMCQA